ncbi:hypothetical protein EJ04DRAFT_416160, partial [Polyplosphaeria fusca]
MDGKNASGRRISLLNDNPAPPTQLTRLSSFSPSLSSRTSSYSSSPVNSPPTPPLVRSNSADSTTMETPSPVTPEFGYEGISPPNMAFPHASFFPSQKDVASAYPPVPQNAGPLAYHAPNASQAGYFRPQQQASDSRSTTSVSANPRSKKNSYPCPMAKQFNCSDYFTTSGHAARHAKKHTGKKDAYCPECNKAFTRKDNMEQHRRTHQSGRNASKTAEPKKAKQQTKRPRPAPIQSSDPSLSSLSLMDPVLPTSPSESAFGMAPAVQPVDSFGADYSAQTAYPDPTTYSLTHSYNPGSSYGLDALAIAASGEKRKFE